MKKEKTKPAIKNRIVGYGEIPLDSIVFNEKNWRIHPKNQQDGLMGILEDVGLVQGVLINRRTDPSWGANQNVETLVDGHLRVTLADRAGEKTIPVTYVDLTEKEEAEILATLDPIGAMAASDKTKLDELLRDIDTGNEEVMKMLAEMAEKEGLEYGKSELVEAEPKGSLADRFGVPPFSVLNAREGWWQARKAAWIALGIKSELGRGGGLLMVAKQVTSENLHYYRNRMQHPAAVSVLPVIIANGNAAMAGEER